MRARRTLARTPPTTAAIPLRGSGRQDRNVVLTTPKEGRTMTSPKIGKAFEKASNALAFQARKLREEAKKAENHDAVLDRLRRLGEDFANEKHHRRKTENDEAVAPIVPLITKARQYLDDAEVARKEAAPVLSAC